MSSIFLPKQNPTKRKRNIQKIGPIEQEIFKFRPKSTAFSTYYLSGLAGAFFGFHLYLYFRVNIAVKKLKIMNFLLKNVKFLELFQ